MNWSELFSTPQGVAAQCVGFVAMGVALFIYTFRDRRKILLSKMVADLLWVGHYGLLGAFSGSLINAVNAVREAVFYHKDHRAWARHIAWPILFLAANAACTLLSWQGPLSLLPMLGSSLNIIGLWCSSPTKLRLISLPAQTLWEIYSIAVGAIPSIIVNAISITSILIALSRDAIEKRRMRMKNE